MSTQIISWIRTVTPSLVGLLASWLLSLGIELDAKTQTALALGLAGLFTAVYHFGVTKLEKRFPQIGVLLGVAKSPDSYSKGEVVAEPVTTDSGTGSPIFDELAAIPYLHN